MMKCLLGASMVLLMGVAGNTAVGACKNDPGGYTNQLGSTGQNTIQDVLNGKRILATGGGEEWKEDHCANGNLYKVGSPTDPTDPRAYRGTWSVSGQGAKSVVTYNYTVGGNSSFTWSLWQNGSGGLCWENPTTGAVVATAPQPANIPSGLSCNP